MGSRDISHHKFYSQKQVTAGLCTRPSCKNLPEPNRTLCKDHLIHFAKRSNVLAARRRAGGLCADAGCEEKAESGRWYCSTHLAIRAKRGRIRYEGIRTDDTIMTIVRGKRALKRRNEHAHLRKRVIDAYGGRCACCGEDQYVFLTIDHVHGDGWKEKNLQRPDQKFKRIIEQDYPPSYQVLCYNCNCAKRNGAHCPHEDMVRTLLRLA